MEFQAVVEGRRSIRKYEDKKIDHSVLEKVVKEATFSPSWKNAQTTGFVVVENEEIKQKIANECVLGFEYNTKTMSGAPAIAIVTIQTGIAGYEKDGSFSTSKEDRWEVFDAGIATQTFCLAAYEQGVGTVVLGIFDEEKVAEVLQLPEGIKVAAIIAMGYPAKTPAMPPRKEVSEVLRIVE